MESLRNIETKVGMKKNGIPRFGRPLAGGDEAHFHMIVADRAARNHIQIRNHEERLGIARAERGQTFNVVHKAGANIVMN